MSCRICGLQGRDRVPGHVDKNPPEGHKRIMCIGEAPGYTETKTGMPFTGESGQLLRKVLEGCG
ncbi:unnamed protein product, partial [marine sediment metagenome]